MNDDLDLDFALAGVRRAWSSGHVSTTIVSDADWDLPHDEADLDLFDDDDPATCEWVS